MIFGFGVLIGILLTVGTVRHLLRNFRSQTIYCIIGLMIGSIYSVIMGPTSLEIPRPPMCIQSFSIIFFIIGCTLVPALEKLKDVLKNKRNIIASAIYGYDFEGRRYDVGDKLGFLEATVDFALRNQNLEMNSLEFLKSKGDK